MFPSRGYYFPDYDGILELLIFVALFLVGAAAIGCLFYFTGSTIFGSALGGLFIIAVIIARGTPELLLSVSIMVMLKLGGPTVVALISPWGGEQALNETLNVVMETSVPQLTVGIFIIFFFLITIPQHALARWK